MLNNQTELWEEPAVQKWKLENSQQPIIKGLAFLN